ncbi:MAG: P1 family peptidase [Candidatus Sumerlaeales bacterium]|nr:P1 family peptidase [Candidatus Sumerlaeales bacterium]
MGLTDRSIGIMKTGRLNLITDVAGVKVGHYTLSNQEIQTGVTAILPHEGNLFREKLLAGVSVINGFGKSVGLMQIDELGTLETPIILTNTLSVGTATTALVRYMLAGDEQIGVSTSTVNPVVMECNDGTLNDIRGLHVKEEHVLAAIEDAKVEFAEGAVGGGTGMSCFGLKGGIGSASRVLELDGSEYTVGALVMSNCGVLKNLIVDGRKIGQEIQGQKDAAENLEKGSIIMIVATDVPMCSRQLRRAAKRAAVALGRVGSYLGNGSGDICLAFSTANRIEHYAERDLSSIGVINENRIDRVFRAVGEAVEEAILSSLMHGVDMVGRAGNRRESLRKYLK